MKTHILNFILISLIGLSACTDNARKQDDETFWKFHDSLDINIFNYYEYDTLKNLLKSEPARKAMELMAEIETVLLKEDSTGNVFSDSAKTIYLYDNDSTRKKLEKLSKQYPSDYFPLLAWAKFYHKVNDYENVEKSLLSAKKMDKKVAFNILLGDNITVRQTTLYDKTPRDPKGNIIDQAAYDSTDNRFSKLQFDYYEEAVKNDSTLYTGLIRLAEKLNSYGKDGKGTEDKKVTKRIKYLIQKAIELHPRWPKAYSSLQYLKGNISSLEYERIYTKQIELGDSQVLSRLSFQKKDYNLVEAERLIKLYIKSKDSYDKTAAAIDLSSIYFAQADIGKADSVLARQIKTIKKDTLTYYDPKQLTDLYKRRAYLHRLYGTYPKALALIDSCIKLDTSYNQQYVVERAMILLRMKRQAELATFLATYLSAISRKYKAVADTTELSNRRTPVENFQAYYNLKK